MDNMNTMSATKKKPALGETLAKNEQRMAKYGLQNMAGVPSAAEVAANKLNADMKYRGGGGILMHNKIGVPSPQKSPDIKKMFAADGGMMGGIYADG